MSTHYRRDADALHERIRIRVKERAEREARVESPQEDIRNALAILDAARFIGGDPLLVSYSTADVRAIEARLWSAVRKLEA